MEILTGGATDARGIQQTRHGTAAITLSIPSRYVHTVTEIVSKTDIDSGIQLLVEFLKSADTVKYKL